MALSRALFLTAIISMLLLWSSSPSTVMATNHVVGDALGWSPKFDYVNWANSRVFRVGDTLEFKYDNQKHSVVRVNGTQFQQCTVPSDAANQTFSSGNDVIVLASAGNKWYICGFPNHCNDLGMKLSIKVQSEGPSPAPAPAPTPNAPPSPSSPASSLLHFSSLNPLLIMPLLLAPIFFA